MEGKLCTADEFKLGTKEIPYLAIKLSVKEVAAIIGKEAGFYSTNGSAMFEMKDNKGNDTGERVLFILFTE